MTPSVLERLFEHNHWANLQIIEVCAALSDEQLDAEPRSATKGTIRDTLTHLVASQRGYVALLTLPVEARPRGRPPFDELLEIATKSGEELLALVNRAPEAGSAAPLRTTDDWLVQPSVVLVQVINHATEHREQICSMLSALGVTPPDLDGWAFGEATGEAVPAR